MADFIKCPACGTQITSDKKSCPICGTAIEQNQTQQIQQQAFASQMDFLNNFNKTLDQIEQNKNTSNTTTPEVNQTPAKESNSKSKLYSIITLSLSIIAFISFFIVLIMSKNGNLYYRGSAYKVYRFFYFFTNFMPVALSLSIVGIFKNKKLTEDKLVLVALIISCLTYFVQFTQYFK